MRLRHIKLAGFKSFADPALIELRHPLVGIVGPNGCGKSNVIDAVRWVLGEARVSELRGSASMKELIFAGSSSRKPLGRASVELLLDNADGRIGGPWGRYAEISVRRTVTSEGQSSYSINGQPVRRRDVQDMFLGTGLGPRSYAIISQGMISNFIKAKPEELRVYLEEAAGVSLYRERRRETETLLAQTRSNLERVSDLQSVKREEAARLEGEAEQARKWNALNDEKTAAESLWYWMQFDDVRRTLERLAAEIAAGEAAIEEKKAEAAAAEASLEGLEQAAAQKQREAAEAAADLRDAQRSLTEAEAEQKRLAERAERARSDLALAEKAARAKEAELAASAEGLRAKQAEKEAAEKEIEEAAALGAAAEEEAGVAEDALGEAREQSEAARSLAAKADTAAKLARASADEAARRADEIARRIERLSQAESELDKPEPGEAEALGETLAACEEECGELRALREEASAAAEEARAQKEESAERYFSALSRTKEASARLEALEAVQKKAEASGSAGEFEKAEGLDQLTLVAESLRIDPRWVTAAEAVIGDRARAKALFSLEAGAAYAGRRPPAPLTFVDARGARPAAAEPLAAAGRTFEPLAAAVSAETDAAARAAADWLCGAYKAESLADALAVRAELPLGAVLVTREGDRVSASGLQIWAASDPSLSLFSRRQEIESLRRELYALEESLGALEAARGRAKAAAEEREAALRKAEERLKAGESALSRARLEHERAQARLAAYRERLEDLKKSRGVLEEEKAEAQAAAEDALDVADGEQEKAQEAARRAESAQRAALRAEELYKAKNAAWQSAVRRSELASLRVRQLAEAISLIASRNASLESDIAREAERRAAAERTLAEIRPAQDESVRNAALDRLSAAEKADAAAGAALDAAQQALSERQKACREAQGAVMPLTEALGVKKVERQVKENLKEQFSQRLDELSADRRALAAEAAARPVKAQSVRSKVLRLVSELAALGPVNHAAFEHLEAVRRTLEATQKQIDDLEKGIATLEAAIRRIDAETRTRIKETFDRVNANFGETFRTLFGGGEASLTMTGEEILEAGVEVRAQPPGKRNASVRLLSGGEQAMAATALVFAIFRLNPAPFCLLDEVDAPLDEANQARLAAMCTEMSAQTQFIVITHHRVTMEYAGSLIGVTMREPGVSRVVSVDVENAVRMAGKTA